MGWFSSKKKTVPPQPRPKPASSSPSSSPPHASLPPSTQQWNGNYPTNHNNNNNNRCLVPQEAYPVPIPCRPPPPPYQDHSPCPPIIVNQHYYLSPPPHAVYPPSHGGSPGGKLRLMGSVANLADDFVSSSGALVHHVIDDGLPRWHGQATQLLNQGAAVCDQIAGRLDSVLTLIDREMFHGHEGDLFTYQPAPQSPPTELVPARPAAVERPAALRRSGKKDASKGQTAPAACSVLSGDYFAKVELYANSRLPMDLPPLKLYIPTYPLMCLAAQYAEKVYEKPQGAEREAHVDAEWRTGTKAMRIKSVSMDHMNTIVFAIRGSATFMDWAVNLNAAPTAPNGFLDDPGNFCHAGFLSAARKMIKPVAARLRQLLDENPHRSSYSLLITGHSAGGAVAALLYSHMLATSKAARSELNVLTGCFKRVHCITFGTPPVSLLPLTKPERRDLKKSLFLTFVNEGDPVARADKAYVKSLLELFAAQAPGSSASARDARSGRKSSSSRSGSPSKRGKSKDKKPSKTSQSLANKASKLTIKSMATSGPPKTSSRSSRSSTSARPVWPVPPSALSAAGRIVVLRSGDPKARIKGKKTVEERLSEGVVAQIATDEQLRDVIWGDPVCHLMKLYAGRIETLAVGAVTAKGGR